MIAMLQIKMKEVGTKGVFFFSWQVQECPERLNSIISFWELYLLKVIYFYCSVVS